MIGIGGEDGGHEEHDEKENGHKDYGTAADWAVCGLDLLFVCDGFGSWREVDSAIHAVSPFAHVMSSVAAGFVAQLVFNEILAECVVEKTLQALFTVWAGDVMLDTVVAGI